MTQSGGVNRGRQERGRGIFKRHLGKRGKALFSPGGRHLSEQGNPLLCLGFFFFGGGDGNFDNGFLGDWQIRLGPSTV